MGKKAPKASRKLAAKGEIKRQIQQRRKHQKVKKQFARREQRNIKRGTINGQSEDDIEASGEEEVVHKDR